MPHFLVVLKPCRPTLAQDASESERAHIAGHFEHLEKRRDAGLLTLAGRTEMAEMGVIVLSAEDEREIDEFLAKDPALRAGLMTAERYPFRLALWGAPDG